MKRKVSVVLSLLIATGMAATPSMVVIAAPHIAPYGVVEAEADFKDDELKDVYTEDDGVTTVEKLKTGDYILVNDVAFTQGLSNIKFKLKADSAGVIEIRDGGTSGESLGNVKFANTNGAYGDFSASLKNISGTHTIAFVVVAGTCSVDNWSAEPGSVEEDPGTTQPSQPEQPAQTEEPEQPQQPEQTVSTATVNPYNAVEAETLPRESSLGHMLSPKGEAINIAPGKYWAVENVDFNKGLTGFVLQAKTGNGDSVLKVYLDGMTGKELASIPIKSKDEIKQYAARIASSVTGKHTVYFVTTDAAVTIDKWQAIGELGAVDPGTTPVDPGQTTATVNPYSAVQVEKLSKDELNGAITPPTATDAISIMGGKHIYVNNVDFANGLGGLQVSAKTSMEGAKLDVYVDKIAGTPIASVEVAKDTKYVTKGAKFDSNIKGVHTVFFVANGGAVTLDSWNAVAGKPSTDPGTTPVDPGTTPVGDTVNPYTSNLAKNAELSNAMVTPKGDLVNILSGGYFVVKNVNFTNGVANLKVNLTSTTGSIIEVRLDKADGDKICTYRLNNQAGEKTATVSKGVTGTHDVYFMVPSSQAAVTVASWSATPAEGTPVDPGTTPVDPGTTPVDPGQTTAAINPYEKVEANALSIKEDSNAMTTPMGNGVVVNGNGYIVAENVDFSQGAAQFEVNVNSSAPSTYVDFYIDEKGDTPVASIQIRKQQFSVHTVDIGTPITGKHNVIIASRDKQFTIEYWKAIPGQGTVDPGTTPVDPGTTPVGDTVNPYTSNSAKNAELSNAMVTPMGDLVNILSGGYFVAKNVNFKNGVAGIKVNVTSKNTSILEVRLDKADGDKICTYRLNNQAGEKTATVGQEVTGTHDVYFMVPSGQPAVTVDSWSASPAQGTVVDPGTTPVDPGTTPVDPGTTTATVNPYNKIEAETATPCEGAMKTPTGNAMVISDKGYVLIKDLDFANGLSGFDVYASASAPRIKLNVYIDDSLTPAGSIDIGTQATTARRITVDSDIKGKHFIYFEAQGGQVVFDAWQAVAAGQGTVDPGTTPVDPGTTTATVNPYAQFEVESLTSDAMSAAMTTPMKDAVSVNPGGYIVVKDVDFAQGVSSIAIKTAGSSASVLEIREGSASGDVIGRVMVNAGTLANATEKNITALKDLQGKHDIYFVVDAKQKAVTIDYWKAVAGQGTVDPGTTPVDPGTTTATVNPYNKVEAETATPCEGAMKTPTGNAMVISDKGYVLIQNVDFANGLSGFDIYASASLPKIKMNVYIDDSLTPAGTVDIGPQANSAVRMVVNSDIKGKHYIYFEAQGGQVVFDAWQAVAAGQGTTPVDPGTTTTLARPAIISSPYSKVEAETGDNNKVGAIITPNKQAVGITANGYVAWNADFTDGVSAIKVKAESSPKSVLEIRLDSPSGELLGKAEISTAAEKTINISKKLKGRKNLYFVNTTANTNLIMDYWLASKEQTTVTPPPVVEPPVVDTGMKFKYTTNEWNGGFQVNCTVTNNSGKQVSSWKLKIKKSDINMTQSWCVNVAQQGDYYVITPMSYNSSLSNGQSVEFGLIGGGTYGGTINYVFE